MIPEMEKESRHIGSDRLPDNPDGDETTENSAGNDTAGGISKAIPDESALQTDLEDSGEEPKTNELLQAEQERFLRLAADFDNYKKRVARDFDEAAKSATVRLIRSLVDIIDNFERALASTPGGNNDESYRKGIDLIYQQFTALLTREGVTAIESVGRQFDPNLHEAILQSPSEEFAEGVISQEVQKGYLLDSRVIRYARVIVSAGKPQADEKNKEISPADQP